MPRVIYFLWDNGVIVYIGMTQYLSNRISGHKDKVFDRVTWIDTNYFDGMKQEAQLIAMFKPKYNVDYVDGKRASRKSKYVEKLV